VAASGQRRGDCKLRQKITYEMSRPCFGASRTQNNQSVVCLSVGPSSGQQTT